MLIHFGVTPYLVFDGDYLPSKAATEVERSTRRAESRRVGLELHRMGKPSQAHLELQKAIDVTPEMARQLIEELKRNKIEYVVAPYEADAQLAYMERKNIIQGVLSEDSDLLVFGVKRLLTKLDQYGDCVEINRSDFTACRDISLIGWSDAEFRRMAILSGCDYLTNINKMGLKTAYRLVRKHRSIEKILRMLQFDAQYRVPSDYLENFRKAELTFLHQRVFCPVEQKLVMATELCDAEPDEFDYIGKYVEPEIAIAVAKGDLNPMTKERIVFRPLALPKSTSPWGLSRSKTISTPSELKPKKPINAFFKSKRVPLAELDPNSLTPSPRQQQLLEEYNGSVLSSPITSSPLVLPPASSIPAPSRRRNLRSPVSTAGRIHQTKRVRLCEDPTVSAKESADGSEMVETSRFFSSTAPEPSPSVRRGTRHKKVADPNIWSDDSITDDVMLGLPDPSISSESEGLKVAVFCETTTGNIKQENEVPKDRIVIDKNPTQESQASLPSSLSSNPSDPSTIKSFASSITSLTFSQSSSQKNVRRLTEGMLKLSEMYGSKSDSPSIPVPTSKDVKIKPSNSGLVTATMGVSSESPSQRLDITPLGLNIETEETLLATVENTPKAIKVVEASPKIASRSLDLPNGVSFCGSEDLIVPNSEDESDERQGSASELEPKAILKIDRFIYSA